MNRRQFIKRGSAVSAAVTVAAELANQASAQTAVAKSSGSALVIDPKPLFDISPWLYMQFMEPLGVSDSSVEASWSYDADDWRKDFMDASRDLAPGAMRFGGLFSRYYKWREGVGPVEKRPWMRNYVWGGKETNRVGTHEFADYCRRIGAEPFYCVNFLGDGAEHYAHKAEGNRTGDATEAADWVSYANDPDDALRRSHGHPEPYNLKLWQIGNETSYGKGGFTKDKSIAATIDFAKAMRRRDPGIKLIGWGDSGWATDLTTKAGDQIDYVAIHMMNQQPVRKDSVLTSLEYQKVPERGWEELMELVHERIEKKLHAIEAKLDAAGSKHPIAITEGHLSLPPNNTHPILTEWLTGVYHARAFNLYQRHGDRVKIATAADFNGTRWTTNALLLQVPAGVSYLLPTGAVTRLFKRHNGRQGVAVRSAPTALDVAASRTGGKIFLHVANMDYSRATEATFAVEGMVVTGAKVFAIAPEYPRQEITARNPEVFKPAEQVVPAGDPLRCSFPARSVCAVELECGG
jgi:alpha-L-arabinofuranosidase